MINRFGCKFYNSSLNFVCFCLLLCTPFMMSEVYDIISNGPGSVLYDMPVNYNIAWKIGDEANFTLPINNLVIGKVTYVKNFIQTNGSTQLQNIFIHGTVPAVPGISTSQGSFSASFYSDTVSANIQYPGGIQYELRPSNIQRISAGMTKTYVMSLVNMTEKYYIKENMPDNMKRMLNTQSKQESNNDLIPRTNMKLEAGAVANMKVLVLYTPQAVAACGSESCMQATITLAMGNYNLALQNSNVAMTVDYVAERIQEYNTYVESADMGTMLGQLGSTISTTRRNTLNCHAVHLTTSNTQYCGIADYSPNGLTSGYSASFFGCIGGYHSLAHEVGHNIGLQHDPSGFGGGGANRGYCWDDATGASNCHRSIMAYGGCVTPSGKTNCDRVKYFSTPLVSEMGNPVGVAGQFDNAQQLRNNILNFMAQFTPSFTPVTPVGAPSLQPITPTLLPSTKPIFPTIQPSTTKPSSYPISPTVLPSTKPSSYPISPTVQPSTKPSSYPISPTVQPSAKPSSYPISPTVQPIKPSVKPSLQPTKSTSTPTQALSGQPNILPTTTAPTLQPIISPSSEPTYTPTFSPSINPTIIYFPTDTPTSAPIGIAALDLGAGTTTGLLSLQYTIIVASLSCLVALAIFAICYLRPQKKKDLEFHPDEGISASQGRIGYDIKDIYRVMSSRKQGSNKHYSTNVEDVENGGISTTGVTQNDQMVMQRNRAFSRAGVLVRKESRDINRIDSGFRPHVENDSFGINEEEEEDEDNNNNVFNHDDRYSGSGIQLTESNDEDDDNNGDNDDEEDDDDMLVTDRKVYDSPRSGQKSARSVISPASAVSVKSLIKAFEKNSIGSKIIASFGLSSKTFSKE